MSAAGVAVPPLIIHKAKHTNTAWIPTDTPLDWRFSKVTAVGRQTVTHTSG